MYARAQIAERDGFDNAAMKLTRCLLIVLGAVMTLIALVALCIALIGWNWLREPLQAKVLQTTGRALAIDGDLQVQLAWPYPSLQAKKIRFANPPWSKEKYLLQADAVNLFVDLPALLQGQLELPSVDVSHPIVLLEQGTDGRKNWLLDTDQHDENAHLHIGQLTLDDGTLGYDDPSRHTHIRASITSAQGSDNDARPADAEQGLAVKFSAKGTYRQLPLTAVGSGGSVLALRDESTPYPLAVDTTVGHTHVKARGTITSLTQLTSIDMQLALSGDNLEQLYPLLGIPAPKSHAYALKGHLTHSKAIWRLDALAGHVGGTDMAGMVEVKTGGPRPELVATLKADLLDLDDIAKMIGSRAAPNTAATQAAGGPPRVLPNVPFQTDRWSSMNADVQLQAQHTRRAQALPMEALAVHLQLHDAVLTLEPLEVDMAGGHLKANVVMDGRSNPIAVKAQLQAHRVLLSQLFPSLLPNPSSLGDIDGTLTLQGRGNSIDKMLATANGTVSIALAKGEVSQLTMEKAGLHVWEMLALKMSGDKRIALRCAVADFDVRNGVMAADTLVFDTQVTTLLGSGTVDLAQETLNLDLNQRTKRTSPLALRSPIQIRGSFAQPSIGVDKTKLALRAAGAGALALVNPLLAVVPLVDPGPGADSDCANLLRDARALHKPAAKAASAVSG